MKIAFYTLGCKVNQYETNVMIERFSKKGYQVTSFDKEADIYVINTCTVTNMSDRKSRQIISRAKKNNSKAVVVAVGCLAQVGKEQLQQIKQIDLILGNEEKKDIVGYIEKYLKNNKQIISVSDIDKCNKYKVEELTTLYEKTRAIVKIQDGCNNFCSYCIIPFARGRVRSKPLDDVIEEVVSIAKNGYKEIVITGIHVCSYGQDLNNMSFIELLEKINSIQGIERIRLSSLEPNTMTDEFIERLSRLNKICPHFHLSIQSGCNETLKRMNRKYTVEDLNRIINKLRITYSDVNITADVIVGFPGETFEEFENTKEILEKFNLNKLHVFQYSKRKGTVASEMKEQINPNVKHERSNELIELSNKCEKKVLLNYINKNVEILTEEFDKEYTKGFTRNYLHTRIDKKLLPNQIVNAQVIDVIENSLICK